MEVEANVNQREHILQQAVSSHREALQGKVSHALAETRPVLRQGLRLRANQRIAEARHELPVRSDRVELLLARVEPAGCHNDGR